jgi:Glycosyl transferase family 2
LPDVAVLAITFEVLARSSLRVLIGEGIHLMPWRPEYPLVSVVIVNWNYAQYVGDAIASVMRQKYTNFECIVVDNASTDDSISVITKAMEHDARFRLVRLPENYGHLGGALTVLDTLKGEYINFLDADDTLFENFLSSHIQVHLATVSPVSFTSSDVMTIGKNDVIVSGGIHNIEQYRGVFRQCLQPTAHHLVPTITEADYQRLHDVTFDISPESGIWGWSPGSANVIRRELMTVLKPDCSTVPIFGGADVFFLPPLFAITGNHIISAPLSTYRVHGLNEHTRLPPLRGIRIGNEDAYARNSAAKRLSLLTLIEKCEQIVQIIAPPLRYFRILNLVAGQSLDSIFATRDLFSATDVKQAVAKKYCFLVKVFGERTVIRELRALMTLKHVLDILLMAYSGRLPVATLRRAAAVELRNWRGRVSRGRSPT